MKIRGMMARKGDTPEHMRRMQQYLFDVLAKARNLNELRIIEPITREVREKYN
jgi:DNA polymerase elongation subunit (family B)